MNELLNIQHCLLLCDYWTFIDTLNKHILLHKNLQVKIMKQHKIFLKYTELLSQYNNIPKEVQIYINSY